MPRRRRRADRRMLLHELANMHAKKSVKRRGEVSEGLVQVKEPEAGQMKALYTVGRRSTRAVLMRRSRAIT